MDRRKYFALLLNCLMNMTLLCGVRCYREKRSGSGDFHSGSNGCHDLIKRYSSCTQNINWDPRKLFNATNCHQEDTKNASLCVERNLCRKRSECVLNWPGVNEDDPNCQNDVTWKKIILLKILCTFKEEQNVTCAKALPEIYLKNRNDWDNTTKMLGYLNTSSISCCIGSIIKIYNSSGNIAEFLPSSWIEAKLMAPRRCSAPFKIENTHSTTSDGVTIGKKSSHNEKPTTSVTATIRTTSNAIRSQTQESKITTHAPTRKQESNSSSKTSYISSKLKASLVIASIIFVVLAFIIGRFVYHRIQRKKRAKYEDYGYSQLKVILDDNLYEDDEDDDDQLLSAT